MIVLKSDYSPSAAGEQQEEDNCGMLQMVLYAAGLTGDAIERYNHHVSESTKLYNEALNVIPSGELREETFKRAKARTIRPLHDAHHILVDVGVTIENVIHEPASEGYYPTIVTTVFKSFAEMEPVARIERPVLDIEEKTYENNRAGFGS